MDSEPSREAMASTASLGEIIEHLSRLSLLGISIDSQEILLIDKGQDTDRAKKLLFATATSLGPHDKRAKSKEVQSALDFLREEGFFTNLSVDDSD